MKNINVNVGPKSSLKNRDIVPRTSLTRSSSLESPKKLRFATGTQLENYRYHRFLFQYVLYNIPIIHSSKNYDFRYSDDALMEVISDCSPRKSRSSSVVCEDITLSCPCIDNVDKISIEAHSINPYLNANTPLLLEHISR